MNGPSAEIERPKYGIGFRFIRLITASASFDEIGEAVDLIPAARTGTINTKADITIALETTVGTSNLGTTLACTLDVNIVPDPAVQPYKVHIKMTGVFATSPETPDTTVHEFATRVGPTIMWPYVRALASQMTNDARHGPMTLDPVNLANMVPLPK